MIYTELDIKQKMTKPAVAFNNAVQFVKLAVKNEGSENDHIFRPLFWPHSL